MKLYSLPLSPYSARVRGAIYAKALPIEIVTPPQDWRTSESYRAINPARRVPVLILDDGTALPESAVIVEYLEDAFPQKPLRPSDARNLARVRLINAVTDLYVMQATLPLFMMLDTPTPDRAAVDAAFEKLDRGLGHLNSLLRPGGYAGGETITIADVWLTPVRFALEGLMSFARRPDLLDQHTAIAGYVDVAKGDPILAWVWQEMTDGLRAFMASRTSSPS
jgi:glutathione S-transferase